MAATPPATAVAAATLATAMLYAAAVAKTVV